MLRTFLAIAGKEFKHFARDLPEVQSIVIAQALQLLLLGSIDSNSKDIPTVIVDQDHSTESRELEAKLRATQTLEVKYLTSSIDQGRDHVRAGRARVVVVIPPDYGQKRAQHVEADVLTLLDGSDANVSSQAQIAIAGVTSELAAESGEESIVRTHKILLFNPEGRTSHFTLPGLLAILLMSEWAYFGGLGLAREREQQTLERLLMAKLDLRGYIAGKTAPQVVFAFANAAFLLAIMRFVFGLPINGNPLLLIASLALFSLTLVALGASFGAAAEDEMEVGGRVTQLQFPVLFLSGYIFPLTSLPVWLLPVAYALPTTHMVEIMRGITLRGVGLHELWPSFLYLTLAPIVLGYMAMNRFRSSINL